MAATSAPPKRRRAATPEPTASLQSAMQEIRRLHEEQKRRDEEFATLLRQRDDELQRVQESIRRLDGSQLSPNNYGDFASVNSVAGTSAGGPAGSREAARANPVAEANASGAAGSREATRVNPVAETNASGAAGSRGATRVNPEAETGADGSYGSRGVTSTELGYKLKPDVFDGSVPLREFLSQFLLIARANGWSESAKTVALASSLRGKARSILDSVSDFEDLGFTELCSRLELRFGESNLTQNFYLLFTNRKQKFGEDFASLGAEIERLSHLAYPECTRSVRDKIACAQFVLAISDGFVKRTLQLEEILSLRVAVERARAVEIIQENSFGKRKDWDRLASFVEKQELN